MGGFQGEKEGDGREDRGRQKGGIGKGRREGKGVWIGLAG
jgi:hypothetical protein